jgi:CRP-like cAMP-binding protein
VQFHRLLNDELDFFNEIGTRHDVQRGTVLVRHGEPVRRVHLVEQGTVAVFSRVDRRRPISAFALPSEVCGAMPALLGGRAESDDVALTNTSVITVRAEQFTAAVRWNEWADRWATRVLWWLAEFGARAAARDTTGLAGEVAVLLRRHRDNRGIQGRALADVLDVDVETVESVLAEFGRTGATAAVAAS